MTERQNKEIIAKLQEKQVPIEGITVEEWQQKKIDNFNNSVGYQNEIDGYNCDICKNKEFVALLDKDGNEVHHYFKCHRIREMLRRAQRSGLGNILTDYTFDKFIAPEDWQKANKTKAMEFCKDNKAHWFFIGGQVGSGKTHLCTAICAHYIEAGVDTQYMLWVEEAKKLKALITDFSEYQNLIDRYKKVDVLYIDDFLKVKNGEEPTPADINLAFELLNHRLLSMDKITIISSEKTLFDLLRYDEATMSRIFKACGRYKVNIEKDINKNYRLKDI